MTVFTAKRIAHAKALWDPEKDGDGQCDWRAQTLPGLPGMRQERQAGPSSRQSFAG